MSDAELDVSCLDGLRQKLPACIRLCFVAIKYLTFGIEDKKRSILQNHTVWNTLANALKRFKSELQSSFSFVFVLPRYEDGSYYHLTVRVQSSCRPNTPYVDHVAKFWLYSTKLDESMCSIEWRTEMK